MKNFFIIISIIAGLALLAVAGAAAFFKKSPTFRETIVQKTVAEIVATSSLRQTSLVHEVLGFAEPRTYLLLFLNNTELRPGGGFIGSYGVVRFENGIPELRVVEGTETLDFSVRYQDFGPPPEPLKKYLELQHWQFRDSNWSPDFVEATKQGLVFYKEEGGVDAEKIDGVIAITPTVIERILAISGPITVDGVTFTSQNFTRTLEDEVEYKYVERGRHFDDRKRILRDLTKAMMKRTMIDIFKHWNSYIELGPKLLQEKQIIFYSIHSEEEQMIQARGWGGTMLRENRGDYILWVDANLGALKTDHAIERSLTYSFEPTSKGFVATAAMRFVHKGSFDKFTSRYRDYARVYVPQGSKLIKAVGFMDRDRSTKPGIIDQGEEFGKQWFGGFVAVEPGKTKTVSFSYLLPNSVVDSIKNGHYILDVQKQIGTLQPGLTLGLDFGKKVVGARPGEGFDRHGDTRYEIETDLLIDRAFQITLE